MTVRKWPVLVVTACLGLLALLYLTIWPNASPIVLRSRIGLFGPHWVYRDLIADTTHFPLVLEGIRSGSRRWAKVAVALQPALDGGPGEEVAQAVSDSFDYNPADSIELLVPSYGADLVCVAGPDRPITRARAKERLLLAASTLSKSPSIRACSAPLRSALTRLD